MKRTKLLCILLAAVMLLSLAACGKGKEETKDPNLLKVGDYDCAIRAHVSWRIMRETTPWF